MMTNKDLMYNFITKIYNEKLLTFFLKDIFNYQELNDINYIFRISLVENYIIIDIYDNISKNRFNRYMFDFKKRKKTLKLEESKNIFVTYINILNIKKENTKQNTLLKLAYLFKLSNSRKLNYAKTFLNEDYINILKEMIKNTI